MPDNDNDPTIAGILTEAGDVHGRAALLLVESLIHGLCEKSALSVGEAAAIVERALHVQAELAEETGGVGRGDLRSHALLAAIAKSLRTDVDAGDAPPQR